MEVRKLWDPGLQELGVLDSLFRRMDRAGTNDDQEAVIIACNDPCRVVATFRDGLLGGSGQLDFVAKESGLDKRVILGQC